MRSFLYFVKGYFDGSSNIAYLNQEGEIYSSRFPSIERRNDMRRHSIIMKMDKKIITYEHDIIFLQEQIKKYSGSFVPLSGSSRNILRANDEAKKLHRKKQNMVDSLEDKLKEVTAKKEKKEKVKADQLKKLDLEIQTELSNYEFGCKKALL